MAMTKNQKAALAKVEPGKVYSLDEASSLVKEVSTSKFDGSVDLAIRLGVDPRKANQMVRGTVSLPHGTGKDIKVLALVPADKEAEAKEAGADYVGLDEYVEKIKGGWTDIDVIITVPAAMGKLGPLGRVLGPRGLMPNPKTGTVTPDVEGAVNNAKAGQMRFRTDKNGIIQGGIGKVAFETEQLRGNLMAVLADLKKAKPASSKGVYFRKITLSTTMGPGVTVDHAELDL